MKAALIVGSLLLTASVAAHADCAYPKAPTTIPDGSIATEKEMIAAMREFKQYNTDLTTYVGCLEQETDARLQDNTLSPEALMQIKALQARKHNSAVEEVQAKAGQFNEQVRIFKARNG